MQLFRHAFAFVITALTAAFMFPQQVAAQIGIKIENPTTFNSVEDIVNTLLGLVRPVIVITLLAILTYSGMIYLTAQDDDSKVAKAKKTIAAALIGFVLIIVAPAIVQFVGALFGIRDDIFGV